MSEKEFDIDRLAKLAYLELSDEDRAQLSKQLPEVIAYIDKLQEVDTASVEAKEYLTDQVNVFRADEASIDAEERKAIIDNFPKEKGGALEVPAVFE